LDNTSVEFAKEEKVPQGVIGELLTTSLLLLSGDGKNLLIFSLDIYQKNAPLGKRKIEQNFLS